MITITFSVQSALIVILAARLIFLGLKQDASEITNFDGLFLIFAICCFIYGLVIA